MGAATEGQLMPSLPSELVFVLPLVADDRRQASRRAPLKRATHSALTVIIFVPADARGASEIPASQASASGGP